MFGTENMYAARYAGLGLCVNLHPTACAVGYRYIASFAGSAVCKIIETPGHEFIRALIQINRFSACSKVVPDTSLHDEHFLAIKKETRS
jgi:hypothetical protein